MARLVYSIPAAEIPEPMSCILGTAIRSVSVHEPKANERDPDPDRLEGRIGKVTVPIPESGPGEIVVAIRGGTERFAAWCDGAVAKHASVVVVEVRSPRSVTVAPFPEADTL
jgi:hypothetical protein